MLVCFDSSALVKLLVEEDGSELAVRLWDEADAVVASRLVVPEVPAALHAARRNGRLAADQLALAQSEWDVFRAGLRLVEVSAAVAHDAARLTADYALAGADAVHLASVLTLAQTQPVLAVWDKRLHAGARALGVRTAPAAL